MNKQKSRGRSEAVDHLLPEPFAILSATDNISDYMFKFNFSEAELEGEDDLAIENGNIETRTAQSVVTRQKDTPTKPVESGESKFREIPLEELVSHKCALSHNLTF